MRSVESIAKSLDEVINGDLDDDFQERDTMPYLPVYLVHKDGSEVLLPPTTIEYSNTQNTEPLPSFPLLSPEEWAMIVAPKKRSYRWVWRAVAYAWILGTGIALLLSAHHHVYH